MKRNESKQIGRSFKAPAASIIIAALLAAALAGCATVSSDEGNALANVEMPADIYKGA